MTFPPGALDVIHARRSCRTYTPTSLDTDTIDIVSRLFQDLPVSPFSGECRLALVQGEGIDPGQKAALGTYGFIKGARDFIAGIVPASKGRHVEHLGYVMEWFILHATAMSLGTCWLAGTFKRAGFASLLGTGASEVIPAVTPVGIPASRPGIAERVIRLAVKARVRKPWETLFFDATFTTPLDREGAGVLAPVLDAVRAGPSASNKQPWRVVKERGRRVLHLFSAGSFKLDRGIAACHVDAAASAVGLDGHWFDEPPSFDHAGNVYVLSWSGE